MFFYIESGIIEDGCKHIIQNQFKRTGMRWSRKGCENLLALRVAYLNNNWELVQKVLWNEFTEWWGCDLVDSLINVTQWDVKSC